MEAIVRAQHMLHRVACWVTVVAVAASAWLFGSTESWAWLTLGMAVFAAVVLWLVSWIIVRPPSFRLPAVTLLLTILLLGVLAQTVPLPFDWVRLLNPMSADVVEAYHRILGGTVVDGFPTVSPAIPATTTLSVAPGATMRAAFLFAVYIGVFLVTANCLHTWHSIRRMAAFLAASGFVLAVVSVAHRYSGSDEMLWVHVPRYGGNFFGSFTNRNHFAFNMLLVLGLTIGLFLASLRHHHDHASEKWRTWISGMSTRQSSRVALLAFACVIVGASIVVSLSRGGIVCMLAGTATAAVLGAFSRFFSRGRTWGLMAVACLIACVVTWLGWGPIADRFMETADLVRQPKAVDRILATFDTLQVMGAFPLFGCGMGTFHFAFPMFARGELQYGRWMHAHNDWAQLLAEGGVVGGFLVLLAIWFFLRDAGRRYSLGQVHVQGFALGCVVALAGAAYHSMLDYSLHRPANAMLVAAVAGLAVAALHTPESLPEILRDMRVASGGEPLPSGWNRSLLPARAMTCTLVAGLIVVIFSEWTCLRNGFALKRFEYAERLAPRLNDTTLLARTVEAGRLEAESLRCCAPMQPGITREIGETLFGWAIDKRLSLEWRYRTARDSLELAAAALAAAPSDTAAWLFLGQSLALNGHWDLAEICRQRAQYLKRESAVELFPSKPTGHGTR